MFKHNSGIKTLNLIDRLHWIKIVKSVGKLHYIVIAHSNERQNKDPREILANSLNFKYKIELYSIPALKIATLQRLHFNLF